MPRRSGRGRSPSRPSSERAADMAWPSATTTWRSPTGCRGCRTARSPKPTALSGKRTRPATRRSGRSPCVAGRRSARCAVSSSRRAATWRRWQRSGAAWLRGSLAPLHVAQELADAGRYGELLGYLSARSQEELEQSPMLTLLCGIAHSRLGRLDLGQQWAMVAQLRARMLGDRTLEVRALNVSGAVALERGGIDEASYFFTRAQEQAMQDNDMATVGRCANNLGIIANMQGDYARAVGAYTRAIAAYEQARYHRGIAESRHNLGITYREQGRLDHALQAA